MKPTTSELVRAVLISFRSTWRRILAVHLVYVGLGIFVFAPLLGVLGQVLLKMSGEPALADMDLLLFALSPTGLIAIGLFATVSIVFIVFEMASLMAIGVANANGQSTDVSAALGFSFKRVKPIFLLAVWMIFKLLVTIAPFLLAAGAVALFLITDYDINYYLAVQPAEFWMAAVIIGIIIFLMAILLIRRLISWSLTLPLVLFVGTQPAKSFAVSTSLTRKNGSIILRSLITWAAASLLLGAVVTVSVRVMGELIVLLSNDSVTTLALLFGLLAALWLTVSALATVLTTGSLALLLTARAIGDLTRLDADFLAVNVAMARPALIAVAHMSGKDIFVWTVNDVLTMSQMMSLGVDGIITDEPLLAREVLTVRAELSSAERLLLHIAPLLGVKGPSLSIKSNDAGNDDANINLELSLHQQFEDRVVSAEYVTVFWPSRFHNSNDRFFPLACPGT